MASDTGLDRLPRPSHRAQRLLIAATVLVAGAVVLLLTHFVGGRAGGRAPQVRVVEPPSESTAVTLYFAAADGNSLVGEPRNLSLPSNPSLRMRLLIQELAAGPAAGGTRILPSGTTLRSVYLLDDGETLCLDFSNDLRTGLGGGSTNEFLALSSILETVRSGMPLVKRVQFLLEGKVVETLNGHYDISRPIGLDDWKSDEP